MKDNLLNIRIAIYYFSKIFLRYFAAPEISSTSTVQKLDAQFEKRDCSFNKTPWRMSVHNKHRGGTLRPFRGVGAPSAHTCAASPHACRFWWRGGSEKRVGACHDPQQDLRTWTFSAYRDKSVILHA